MLVKKGAHLLDADKLAKEAVLPGAPAWQEIVQWLGEEILLPDRTLDRLKLANLVFSDRRQLEKLNKIVHPRVGQRFLELAEKIKEADPGAVLVYDIPLLIEAGLQKMVDSIMLVYVPRAVQVERLMRRDSLSQPEAEKRIRAQMPLEEKRKHAAVIIDNSGALEETLRQVNEAWDKLTRL